MERLNNNESTEKLLSSRILDYPKLKACNVEIKTAIEMLIKRFEEGKKVLICGNGGSACDSEHFTGEMMKGFLMKRRVNKETEDLLIKSFCDGGYLANNLQGALPVISLVGGIALNTAFANDVASDMVFAQQVYGLGNENDVLVGISTTGNSRNIINAIKIAKIKKMYTIGLTGESGGEMKEHCDICICVPETETYRVQELHLPIIHILCETVEKCFFES